MVNEYFIRIRGKVQGPLGEYRLQMMARRGQFSRFHEISLDGESWVQAEEYPQLFSVATPAAVADREDHADQEVEPAEPLITASSGWPGQSGVEWYYLRGGQEFGPVDTQEVRALLGSGRLSPNDLARSNDMAGSVPICTIPALIFAADGRADEDIYRPRLAPLAMLSLISALLWLVGIGSLLAIICGGIAVQQINDSDGRLTGKGLAATGILIGVCSLIITVVVGGAVLLQNL